MGLPHSQVINDLNFTLEEYFDNLKEKKIIEVANKNSKYRIYYKEEGDLIPIPKNNEYTISRDNLGGIIITELMD